MRKLRTCVFFIFLTMISFCLSVSARQQVEILPPLKTVKGDILHPPKAAPQKNLRFEMLSTDEIRDWFNKSPELDNLEGASVDRAYAQFNPESGGETVVVAVIDSGVDILHEDLKDKIWVNEDEIPDNGVDDDMNGFVDDIHGWNFIGGKDGRNVEFDTLEVTREYSRYMELLAAGTPLTEKEKKYFEGVARDFEESSAYAKEIYDFSLFHQTQSNAYMAFLNAQLGITDFSMASLERINNPDPAVMEAVNFLIETLNYFRSYERLGRYVEYYYSQVNYHYNPEYDSRSDIVRDNPEDLTESDYGNNDVTASFSSHGTHVAGIIAADRFNNLGISGIAANVRIMAVRTVPNGDERDKDVANAVRYAVDNGAQIINMSFGKGYSPNKSIVDEAFQYAEDHDVLIVHAAGNDSANNDSVDNFPNRYPEEDPEEMIGTWLDVGASSYLRGADMVAYFSNFGPGSVDLFAPGHLILSTVPDNQYESYSGTSMASPVVAGVAALLLSQDSELDGEELKELLLDTVRTYPDLDVRSPENPELLVPFMDLSITGGIVDAYRALQLLNGDE